MDDVKLFTATKALISHEGKILLIQESNIYSDGTQLGKFDVVGGRITPGENFEDCLKREVLEETGLEIILGKPFFVIESRSTVRGENWQIIRIFFEAFSTKSKVTLSEDHENYVWINPKDYKNYKIIENLEPVFEAYLTNNIKA